MFAVGGNANDTGVIIELPARTISSTLNELVTAYEDRERLMSEDGLALARSWNMSMDDALEFIAEYIDFHLFSYVSQRLSDDDDTTNLSWDATKAAIAQSVIERTTSVAAEQVIEDIERQDFWKPMEEILVPDGGV